VTDIDLSREELEAACKLVESGLPRQAISRAYYAAFYAARAALEANEAIDKARHVVDVVERAIAEGLASERAS
jgi:uncharacterized protein (UPF0332 family)